MTSTAPTPHRSTARSEATRSRRIAPKLPALVLLAAALPALSGCGLFEALGVDPLGPQPLAGAARSAMSGHGNVQVTLEPDGTAIVAGWVEDRLDEQAVLREVAGYPGVTGVVDHLTVEDWPSRAVH